MFLSTVPNGISVTQTLYFREEAQMRLSPWSCDKFPAEYRGSLTVRCQDFPIKTSEVTLLLLTHSTGALIQIEPNKWHGPRSLRQRTSGKTWYRGIVVHAEDLVLVERDFGSDYLRTPALNLPLFAYGVWWSHYTVALYRFFGSCRGGSANMNKSLLAVILAPRLPKIMRPSINCLN